MGLNLPERQRWAERALLGVTFWIGHRQALYPNYHLVEAELVGELCVLLHANRPSGLVVLREQNYVQMLPLAAQAVLVSGGKRADLVIADEGIRTAEAGHRTQYLRIAVEVKRSPIDMPEIQKDMRRLHEMLEIAHAKDHTHLRGWLIVISESKLPHQFVTEKATSQQGVHTIEGVAEAWYVVRKTCKAVAELENIPKAHFACLIEVFREEPRRITAEEFDVPG